jgi:tetratricopeptide (TPR) repeat protein
VALFTIEKWRKRAYYYDYNKDGNNWYDYRRKIDALELLVNERTVEGRSEWRGGMYFHLALACEDISLYYNAREEIEQITKAKNAMQNALAFVEKDGYIRTKLAQYHLATDDIDDGIRVLQGHAVSVIDFQCLSRLYVENGDYEKAIDSLSKAIEIRDSFSGFHFELGGLYELTGEMENANNSYRLALQYLPKTEEYLAHFVGRY